MKKYAFIDLDGVVADFHKSAFAIHEKPYPEIWPNTPEACWSETMCGLTDKEFWSKIDYNFWMNLQPMSDAGEIIGMILSYIPVEQCAFLTSPTIHSPAASAKMAWIMKYFPLFKRRFLIGAPKEMCAGPNKILIDDLEKNISGFTKAGGAGLLLPRPWNSRQNELTLEVLDRELERFVNA